MKNRIAVGGMIALVAIAGIAYFYVSKSSALVADVEHDRTPYESPSIADGSASGSSSSVNVAAAEFITDSDRGGADVAQGIVGEPAQSASSSTVDNASRSTAGEYGPYEASLLTDGFLNDQSQAVLKSRSIDSVVNELQKESNADTAELQQGYRMEVEDALRSIGAKAQLDRFACGKNVCIGSVRSSDLSWKDDWSRALRQKGRLPTPSLSLLRVKLDEGAYELRFVFTTQPGPGGFVIRKGQGA